MIRKPPIIIIILIAATAAIIPVSASTATESAEPAAVGSRRWVRSPIIVSFSTSLNSPPPNIKVGSDIAGALQRALQSWTSVADIQFFETVSTTETISPATDGDGINLITVSTANASVFEFSDAPARTRVFYDSGGSIVEADIALNPSEQFSTDGTPGTYDLESTFAHEVGHLIGLEHSAVIGATMQPRQTKNGVYGLPAFSQRTLSEADAAQARALYRPAGVSSIAGRLTTNVSGRARSVIGAHLFAEDAATGRVVASDVSSFSGQYRIAGLRPGVYRVFAQSLDVVSASDLGASGLLPRLTETSPPFRSFIASNSTPSHSVNLNSNTALRLGFFVFSVAPTLAPRLIGMNRELSTSALPLRAGETFTIYIAGDGVDDIALADISLSSPLIRVVPDSLKSISFDVPYPVIAFEVVVDEHIQPGDYTVRLQSRSGEQAYLPGAITIEVP